MQTVIISVCVDTRCFVFRFCRGSRFAFMFQVLYFIRFDATLPVPNDLPDCHLPCACRLPLRTAPRACDAAVPVLLDAMYGSRYEVQRPVQRQLLLSRYFMDVSQGPRTSTFKGQARLWSERARSRGRETTKRTMTYTTLTARANLLRVALLTGVKALRHTGFARILCAISRRVISSALVPSVDRSKSLSALLSSSVRISEGLTDLSDTMPLEYRTCEAGA